jgi:hypothetical protein
MGMGIDTNSKASWQIHRLDFTWTWLEVPIGILGVDSALDGGPARFDVALFEG